MILLRKNILRRLKNAYESYDWKETPGKTETLCINALGALNAASSYWFVVGWRRDERS